MSLNVFGEVDEMETQLGMTGADEMLRVPEVDEFLGATGADGMTGEEELLGLDKVVVYKWVSI